ncbi:MAG TPA: hypothetical protein DDX92_09650 [Flavobacteriales bacterium]|jgi:NTE family protein|nr:hypothetical protein [Flavobacteriales bacterium]
MRTGFGKIILFLLITLMLTNAHVSAQKVGLVLSGGGADALAHIGVIKALEEHHIPIDYITATSMGALVGALYASGQSPAEMEVFFTSRTFLDYASGRIPNEYIYFFPNEKSDATIIPVRFKRDSTLRTMLPSRIVSAEPSDFSMMATLGPAGALSNYDFDNLMLPFRCVAADITTKTDHIFRSGNLNTAVRSSLTYPLFFRPIEVDGKLMYDGGIYNNFPSDVMCNEFNPDIVIGSNVSENSPPPDPEDLFSQLISIVTKPSKYEIDCEQGMVIEPGNDFGTFAFEKAEECIDSGYATTLTKIDTILSWLDADNRIDHDERREKFIRKRNKKVEFSQFAITGLTERQSEYALSIIERRKKTESTLSLEKAKRNYFRLFQEKYVNSVFPEMRIREDSTYEFRIHASPRRSLEVDIGGNLASRPVSTGFLALSYSHLGRVGFHTRANVYFGRFYRSGSANFKFEFPTKLPFYIRPLFTVNSWNWFESRTANLFIENKPNFIIEQEWLTGLDFGIGIGNKLRWRNGVYYFQQRNYYYQEKDFSPSDTTDESNYMGLTIETLIEGNDLNRRQYPYQGRKVLLKATFVGGEEDYSPGSTSTTEKKRGIENSFFMLRASYDQYFRLSQKLRMGVLAEGVYSSQIFFNNYTATVIQAPYFKPTPDSRTLFLESFHANQFLAGGVKFVYKPFRNFQFRSEFYVFQPYQAFVRNEDQSTSLDDPWKSRYTILSGTVVYESFLGPLSFSVNYYYDNPDISLEDEEPVTFLLNFGYILFNRRVYR